MFVQHDTASALWCRHSRRCRSAAISVIFSPIVGLDCQSDCRSMIISARFSADCDHASLILNADLLRDLIAETDCSLTVAKPDCQPYCELARQSRIMSRSNR
jgi:hypothetical protein